MKEISNYQEEYFQLSKISNNIFVQAIHNYHIEDNTDAVFVNAFLGDELNSLLYQKCWIDTVQWHLEDNVRKVDIEPQVGLSIKRKIDQSNEYRTNIVELIDDYFLKHFSKARTVPLARLNTETIAWALDRLSILNLKIHHMRVEVCRDADPAHLASVTSKLAILNDQRDDLSKSIDELYEDLSLGIKKMKVYRQLKMYNDPTLNPVMYQSTAK